MSYAHYCFLKMNRFIRKDKGHCYKKKGNRYKSRYCYNNEIYNGIFHDHLLYINYPSFPVHQLPHEPFIRVLSQINHVRHIHRSQNRILQIALLNLKMDLPIVNTDGVEVSIVIEVVINSFYLGVITKK